MAINMARQPYLIAILTSMCPQTYEVSLSLLFTLDLILLCLISIKFECIQNGRQAIYGGHIRYVQIQYGHFYVLVAKLFLLDLLIWACLKTLKLKPSLNFYIDSIFFCGFNQNCALNIIFTLVVQQELGSVRFETKRHLSSSPMRRFTMTPQSLKNRRKK